MPLASCYELSTSFRVPVTALTDWLGEYLILEVEAVCCGNVW